MTNFVDKHLGRCVFLGSRKSTPLPGILTRADDVVEATTGVIVTENADTDEHLVAYKTATIKSGIPRVLPYHESFVRFLMGEESCRRLISALPKYTAQSEAITEFIGQIVDREDEVMPHAALWDFARLPVLVLAVRERECKILTDINIQYVDKKAHTFRAEYTASWVGIDTIKPITYSEGIKRFFFQEYPQFTDQLWDLMINNTGIF